MKIIIYKNGRMLQRMTAQHLDITKQSLCIYGVTTEERKLADYAYYGPITFTLVTDVLSIDIFEPDGEGKTDHIRITAVDW